MKMKLKPFKEILKMSKEKLDEAMAPIRAHKVKTQAQLEMAKIDEKLVTLEAEIQEMCTQREINFDALIKKLDDAAIQERRKKQYAKIVQELFPA
jgi:exonuclease VII large subunit